LDSSGWICVYFGCCIIGLLCVISCRGVIGFMSRLGMWLFIVLVVVYCGIEWNIFRVSIMVGLFLLSCVGCWVCVCVRLWVVFVMF